MPTDIEKQKEQLLQLIRASLEHDKALREEYQIGDKFRFIRDRLTQLVARVEESVNELEKDNKKTISELFGDETIIYVYLYNAQGLVIKTWQKMLNADVFYEYSVNRPLYTEKAHIEAFIRSKPNKVQHAYLTVKVKKEAILDPVEAGLVKDAIGNVIVKVKEGSLAFNKLISFTHNGIEYLVNEAGELERKES